MAEIKIVFTGSMGAGKSSAIAAISDIDIISTDVATNIDFIQNTNEVIKEKTTVAMDYGEIRLNRGPVVKLYGTPGQQRFSYMWDILSKGALGIIILVDNRRKNPLHDLEIYLNYFKHFVDSNAVVIGITHTDMHHQSSFDEIMCYLKNNKMFFPLLPIDARKPDDVIVLVESFVALLQSRHY